MAFHKQCPDAEVRIHQTDHDPPHCHVRVNDGVVKFLIETLEYWKGRGTIRRAVRKCLRDHQTEMLDYWYRVVVPLRQAQRRSE